MINVYTLCKNELNIIGILAMNYYKKGSIGNYKWNVENFVILKNLLKQTVFAVLNAYIKTGFIHGDLHCDNILIKDKRVCEIDYCYKKLPINTFEVRIMDFEKSKLNKNLEFKYVLDNISKLFNSVADNDRYLIKIYYKNGMFRKMKNQIIMENINAYSINETHYNILETIIESFYIEYEK
jgi:predicted unusual protein kinase regulating ubiquinone biosynthesis (AarF/ABC1/UbiB family)